MRDLSHLHIAIVGLGNVGRSILNILLQDGRRRYHIDVIDPSPAVDGSFRDLYHASMLHVHHSVEWNPTHGMSHADFIFYCAGQAIPMGQSREYALEQNLVTVESVFHRSKPRPDAVLISVTNPVDVIALQLLHSSGLDSDRVVGVGTMIESARLRAEIAHHAGADPDQVSITVVGEHGVAMVPVLSQSTIGGRPLAEYLSPSLLRDCVYECRMAADRIKATQGASYFAAANAAVLIMRHFLTRSEEPIVLSIYHEDEKLFFSWPVNIQNGCLNKARIELDHNELEALEAAISKLRFATVSVHKNVI